MLRARWGWEAALPTWGKGQQAPSYVLAVSIGLWPPASLWPEVLFPFPL